MKVVFAKAETIGRCGGGIILCLWQRKSLMSGIPEPTNGVMESLLQRIFMKTVGQID